MLQSCHWPHVDTECLTYNVAFVSNDVGEHGYFALQDEVHDGGRSLSHLFTSLHNHASARLFSTSLEPPACQTNRT